MSYPENIFALMHFALRLHSSHQESTQETHMSQPTVFNTAAEQRIVPFLAFENNVKLRKTDRVLFISNWYNSNVCSSWRYYR